jgi:hypothetical protein
VLYQSFEAYHTAKALRDGLPLPDPLGLNEVGNWLNLGARPQVPGQPGAGPAQPAPGPAGQGPVAGGYPPAGQYQPPYGQSSYQAPYPPPVPPIPPIPPVPPIYWRRKEPIGAIVLIALGLLFLLGQMNLFNGRLMEFAWPLLLIGLGVWLIVRRIEESHGGSK